VVGLRVAVVGGGDGDYGYVVVSMIVAVIFMDMAMVVVAGVNFVGYIILLCYLYCFNLLYVKIESLILSVL